MPQNLPYLKQSLGEIPGETVNCYPQSDTSDGIEQLASLFLVQYSILCLQWSPSDNAAEATDDFLLIFFFLRFFFLINNTV